MSEKVTEEGSADVRAGEDQARKFALAHVSQMSGAMTPGQMREVALLLIERVSDQGLVGSRDLAEILRKRGLVPCVFGPEDVEADIENDPQTADFSDEEKWTLQCGLFDLAARGLDDRLAEKGNDYLSDQWEERREGLIAEVIAACPPVPGPV